MAGEQLLGELRHAVDVEQRAVGVEQHRAGGRELGRDDSRIFHAATVFETCLAIDVLNNDLSMTRTCLIGGKSACRALQSMFLDAIAQRVAADVEQARGAGHVPLGLFQRLHQVLAFDRFERRAP